MMAKMQAVEVTKGAEMIKYGPNTVAGVLNLVTRAVPERRTGGAELSTGSNSYQKLTGYYGDQIGDFGFIFEATELSADGFKALDSGGDTGFDKSDLMAKLAYQWDTETVQQVVQLKLGYADELSNETYLGLSDDDFSQDPYRRYAVTQLDLMDWQHDQVQLSHQMVADQWDVTTRIYRNNFERSWSKVNGLRANRQCTAFITDDFG